MTPEFDWSQFEPVEQQPSQQPAPQAASNGQTTPESQNIDWSKYETVEKPKAGKLRSIGLGIEEAIVGLPALIQYGVNEWSKGIEKGFGDEAEPMPFEKENPLLAHLASLPESEDEAARRLRVGASGITAGAAFGIPGIIAGLVGSQAGQTVREVYGKEGKFENFGPGEIGAIAADIGAGGLASAFPAIARGIARGAGAEATRIPLALQRGENIAQRSFIKASIQGDKTKLHEVINNFSQNQLRQFEQQAAEVSPNRYTQFIRTNASELRNQADAMFRQSNLNIISPLAPTAEQGGLAIQQSANAAFEQNVLTAERAAYSRVEPLAEGTAGTAPKTLQEAKDLRAKIIRTEPTAEQSPVVKFLDGLIGDLEENVAEQIVPGSNILDASGNPVSPSITIPASTNLRTRTGNEMIQMVQNGNQAVNYGSELRNQSHRLAPLMTTFRTETRSVVGQNPLAIQFLDAANLLHTRNAQTWGTRAMRNVRFAEKPESIIQQMKNASTLRNIKTAIPNQDIQNLMDRLVVDNITQTGKTAGNRTQLNNLSEVLSPQARAVGEELINSKDPLTQAGGRAAVRNQVLTDAAQSVNTGKRPQVILDLMQTPKGYNVVREAMNASPESRELMRSFERLFMEDVVSSFTDKSGQIDFSKAKNIIKNDDMRNVLTTIAGEDFVSNLERLEGYAHNFERNKSLFTNPETISLTQRIIQRAKTASIVGAILHSIHTPVEVMAMLSAAGAVYGVGKAAAGAVKDRVLSNPRMVTILEDLSRASSPKEFGKQLTRLAIEVEKTNPEE